jgi:aminopeptidase N
MPQIAEGARDVLTEFEAEGRAARISNCHYTLAFDITAGAPAYKGDIMITFDCAGPGDTFLDHRGSEIKLLEVNGRQIEPDWTGYRLRLPGDTLAARNTVHIEYENEYDHQGDGFHQFIDPADGQEYLYSNFEPYEAHRLFPCFDQPDIKATYRLTVTAPSAWEVIANYSLESAEPAESGRTTRHFKQTVPISTYIFALVAGPYHAFREEHNGTPIGLFCRKSLAEKLDAAEVFTITRQGLDFFAEFFDFPYPFDKYDQIFVPEFNSGAMENAGCVTHNEYMVFREPPTDNQRRNRAETVLHEMAHMWFGDLVTMRWWNDLWLNESFATYMAFLCMEKATRFTWAWQNFNASVKNWAYRQDQLVTTHPIAGEVPDTDATFLNFDGITYGKGASVLKQLVAAIGLDGFRDGMRYYFRTHAFGNTTLAQFIASLEAGSGKELQEWSRLWLETPSLNTIAAEWERDGDRLTSLALTQTAPPDYATIRPHRLDLGLLHEGEDGAFTVSVLPVNISGERVEVAEARGMKAPLLVFPNYNDHAYAKIALDPESVTFAHERLQEIDDPMLRQMLWSSLWNMTRDAQLKPTSFLDLVRSKIPLESNIELVDSVLGQASTALARYVPDDIREREAHLLFEATGRALRATTDSDAQITWARAHIGAAVAEADVLAVARLADGDDVVTGLTIDQDMRWSIAVKFAAFGLPGARDRLAHEVLRDPTDRGQRAKLQVETSFPDPAVKEAAWERITGDGYGSLYLTAAAMGGFNWWRQRELLRPYVDRFFDEVATVYRTRDKEFASDFFRSLFPSYRVEAAVVERGERLLATVGEELPTLARTIREANDELARAIRCRALVTD